MASWPAVYDSGRWETSGAATAASDGATVTAGALNTKGSWAELAAATALAGDLLIVQPGACSAAADYLVDIGIGAAGSEQTIVSNLFIRGDSSNDCVSTAMTLPLPIAIPAGTRLAVRAQSDITNATDRLFDAVLYGVG